MTNNPQIKKIKDKIDKDEQKLHKMIAEVEKIWEDTGLDPKDSSYLIEKTMRFEMAQRDVGKVISFFNEIIEDYKKLCAELDKSDAEYE
jgi:uncharacterized protein YpuA (DUF1002 family)